MKKKLLFCISFLWLSARGLEQYPGGDLPTQMRLSSIEVGASKEKVLRVLGTPASESIPLSDGTSFILYVQNLKESRAFLSPKEVKRDVYVYYFDKGDILLKQDYLTLSDAEKIAFDRTITQAGGKELSLFEQLVQNFGRYNTGAQDSSIRQ